MTRRLRNLFAVGFVALAMLATVASGTAQAKKGVGKSVDSSEIEDHTIQCVDIAAAVFPAGCPDTNPGGGPGPVPSSPITNVSFQTLGTTPTTTLFAGDGLTIIADCTGGLVNVRGVSNTDNQIIKVIRIDEGAVTTFQQDDDFDTNDQVSLNVAGNEVTTHGAFTGPLNGSKSHTWILGTEDTSNFDCQAWGTVQ